MKNLLKHLAWSLNSILLALKKQRVYDFASSYQVLDVGSGLHSKKNWLGIDGGLFVIYRTLPLFVLRPFFNLTNNSKHATWNAFTKNRKSKIIHHNISYSLPFRKQQIPNIYSSHFLEHLTEADGRSFIKECSRILQDNGAIRICTPERKTNSSVQDSSDGQTEPFSAHKKIYSFKELSDLLKKNGFINVTRATAGKSKYKIFNKCDSRDGLLIEATKKPGTKIAMVTNVPSPYREGLHRVLAKKMGAKYHVFYCLKKEIDRFWKIDPGTYDKTFLKNNSLRAMGRTIYINFDITKKLNVFDPDVVIAGGFSPTMLLAFAWCKRHRRKFITISDGTAISEGHLTSVHRFVRKIIYRQTNAFIAISKKTMSHYRSYGIDKRGIFISSYSVDNDLYAKFVRNTKKYEIIFSGQFIDRKMPLFFTEVAKLVNQSIRCRVAVMGGGKLKKVFLKALNKSGVEFKFLGFRQSDSLPRAYSSAKILLFPTKADAWGVVCNEACAAGLPVITCDNAGAANELIIHNKNGLVLPLDEVVWSKNIVRLLQNSNLHDRFSRNAVHMVKKYSYDNSANAILDAVQFAQTN